MFHVYVKTDSFGNITDITSSAFLTDIDGFTQIDSGDDWKKYGHAQGNYFPKSLYTEEGYPRYKLVNGKPMERTDEELEADHLPVRKAQRIAKSKEDLEAYLLTHPLTWTDGEQYAITEEKQNQLTSTLMAAQLDGNKPEWNTTGGVCKEWELSELTSLAVAIKNRVKSLVKYQQSKEMELNAATTLDELEKISIDYSSI